MIFVYSTLFAIAMAVIMQLISYILYYSVSIQKYKSFYPTKELLTSANLGKEEILKYTKQLYLHRKIRHMFLTEDYVSFEDNSPLLLGNVYYIRFQEPCIISYRGMKRVYRYNRKKLEEITLFFSM
jgi:hypothetical protein